MAQNTRNQLAMKPRTTEHRKRQRAQRHTSVTGTPQMLDSDWSRALCHVAQLITFRTHVT